MFLSQILLDRMNKKTIRLLSDVYCLHQFVMSGFTGQSDIQRVLFRVEPEIKDRLVSVLVQSQTQPIRSYYEENGAGVLDVQMREVTPQDIELTFQTGTSLRFRLRANPVVTRDGKRRGLIRDEPLESWLLKKEKSAGASFHSMTCIDEGYVFGEKIRDGKRHRLNLKTVRYEGILKVIDPEVFFDKAIKHGIGPAKGLGFGLLSVPYKKA